MKKIFIFSKNQDISSRNVNFFNIKNYSLRNRFRDYFDTIIRRPFYSLIYNNFFKK